MSSGNAIRRLDGRQRSLAVILAVVACGALPARPGLAEPPRPAPPRTVVDPAVVPAGGCRGCNAPSCRMCQGRHGVHHAGCRDGKCHPHCPVRPQEFGFYGTQWRRWPDRQVVPVAHEREGTPALPPRSQVPRSEEESRRATEDPAESPDEDAATDPKSVPEEEPTPRRPQPPRGDEDPALLPDASGGLQPQFLPPAMRGDDGFETDRPRPLPVDRQASAPWRRSTSARQDMPLPISDAVPPEPAPTAVVVTTAAEADADIDESSLGPVRRRFVARRPAIDTSADDAEPSPSAGR